MVERCPESSGPSAVMQIEQLGEFGGTPAMNRTIPSQSFAGRLRITNKPKSFFEGLPAVALAEAGVETSG